MGLKIMIFEDRQFEERQRTRAQIVGFKKLQTIRSKDLTRMKVTIVFVHSDSIVRGVGDGPSQRWATTN